MNSTEQSPTCVQTESVTALALGVLPAAEISAIRAHLGVCAGCQAEYDSLQAVVSALPTWRGGIREPSASLWERLATCFDRQPDADSTAPLAPFLGREPEWKDVAPGLSCKILSVDAATDRVSMLVRLAPGTDYPPHIHGGVEELHLLDGELWIDERKLRPGDYDRAEAGTRDRRVWSETGCSCILITSLHDQLQ